MYRSKPAVLIKTLGPMIIKTSKPEPNFAFHDLYINVNLELIRFKTFEWTDNDELSESLVKDSFKILNVFQKLRF